MMFKKKNQPDAPGFEFWWAFPDLNWGPADYESDALTN